MLCGVLDMSAEYGMIIQSSSGKLIMSNDGILQTWGDTVSNYCEKTSTTLYPLHIYMYLPNNILTLNTLKLYVYIANFRHYLKSLQNVTTSLNTVANVSHNHGISVGLSNYFAGTATRSGEVSGHSYVDGYVANTSSHRHNVTSSRSAAGSHIHSAIPHNHPINPGITAITTTNVTGITGTIEKIGITGTTNINFTIENNYFINTTNLITTFFNNILQLPGWYRITITTTNNTTKKIIGNYIAEGMMGVMSY